MHWEHPRLQLPLCCTSYAPSRVPTSSAPTDIEAGSNMPEQLEKHWNWVKVIACNTGVLQNQDKGQTKILTCNYAIIWRFNDSSVELNYVFVTEHTEYFCLLKTNKQTSETIKNGASTTIVYFIPKWVYTNIYNKHTQVSRKYCPQMLHIWKPKEGFWHINAWYVWEGKKEGKKKKKSDYSFMAKA